MGWRTSLSCKESFNLAECGKFEIRRQSELQMRSSTYPKRRSATLAAT